MFTTKMLSKIFKLQIVPSVHEIYLLHYPVGGLQDASENLHTVVNTTWGMVHVFKANERKTCITLAAESLFLMLLRIGKWEKVTIPKPFFPLFLPLFATLKLCRSC